MKYIVSTFVLIICLYFSSTGQEKLIFKESQVKQETKQMSKVTLIEAQHVKKNESTAEEKQINISMLRKLAKKIKASPHTTKLEKQKYCATYEECSQDEISGEERFMYRKLLKEVNPSKYVQLFLANTKKQ
jgi:hypothetical protein